MPHTLWLRILRRAVLFSAFSTPVQVTSPVPDETTTPDASTKDTAPGPELEKEVLESQDENVALKALTNLYATHKATRHPTRGPPWAARCQQRRLLPCSPSHRAG